MIWKATALSWLLAAGTEAGGVSGLIAEGLSRPDVNRRMEQMVSTDLAARGIIYPRQSATASNATSDFNPQTWDAQVSSVCLSTLAKLPQASNPSGTCLCYNLPAMNKATGKFAAELRLYRISTPRDAFAGIAPSDIQVALSYDGGASVKSVSEASLLADAASIAARQTSNATIVNSANSTAAGASTGNVVLLQKYMFEGQLSRNVTGLSVGAIEALLMPTVMLSAVNAAGNVVSTNVTANEAAFMVGVFANETVISTTGAAQRAVNDQIAALHNGTVAFVVPGYSFMLFPVGLVICSTWLLVGLIAYGMGTFARIQYAEAYKRAARRTARPAAGRM